jgi:hypothetical protein
VSRFQGERTGRRQALLATASLDHTVRVWRRRAPPAAAPAAARGWTCTHTLELPGPATFVQVPAPPPQLLVPSGHVSSLPRTNWTRLVPQFQPRSVQARPPCAPPRGMRPSAHGRIIIRISEQLMRCRCATYAVPVCGSHAHSCLPTAWRTIAGMFGTRHVCARLAPLLPPPPRTDWTPRVPAPVLIGHAASLSPFSAAPGRLLLTPVSACPISTG